MNMDYEGFEKSCLELGGSGGGAADVYGSEDCRAYMAAKGGVEKEEIPTVLLRMQLEQERFFCLKSLRKSSGWENMAEVRLAVQQDVLGNLQQRLSHKTRAERRGILLHMLEEACSLNGHPVPDENRVFLARMPEEELESWLAEEIVRCAEGLFGEYGGGKGHGGGGFGEQGDGSFWKDAALSGAVLSVAAYVHCPELRGMPELIADFCTGAAFVAEKKFGGRDEAFSGLVTCMVLLEASLLLTCLLFPASPTGALVFLAGSGLTLAGAKAFFQPYFELFSVSLELSMGKAGADLAAKSAAHLAEVSSTESPAGDGERMDASLSWLEKNRKRLFGDEKISGYEENDESENVESEEQEEEQEVLFRERI